MRKKTIEHGYLLLDSSYTQAANPCTMRDFGYSRNAVYNFTIKSANESDSKNSDSNRLTSGRSALSKNNHFSGSKKQEAYPFDDFYTVVRANDYTKNISEPLFQPGMTTYVPAKENVMIRPKSVKMDKSVRYRDTNNKSSTKERCKMLRIELNEEREFRKTLQSEMKQIREEMQTRLDLVNLKMSGQSFYKN